MKVYVYLGTKMTEHDANTADIRDGHLIVSKTDSSGLDRPVAGYRPELWSRFEIK